MQKMMQPFRIKFEKNLPWTVADHRAEIYTLLA
jgi:hypothetical protein